ncbi:MAG: SpoIIE family protein phosphatase, partial [Bacteroidota bacterium]
ARLWMLSLYAAVPVFIMYIRSLYPDELNRKILIAFQAIAGIAIFIVLFLPKDIFVYTVTPYRIIIAMAAIYVMIVIIRALIRKRDFAAIFLVGFAIFFIAIINDILLFEEIIKTTNLGSIGLFIFVFSQAYMLTARSARAFSQNQDLTKQLEFQKNNLENLVKIRTTEIEKQNETLEIQAKKLEQANNSITSGITYASRIQNALLPSKSCLENVFPDSFILFKPRDIVSGDFYWLKKTGNLLKIVVADCTGHGVPGAFMSLLGISYLNEIAVKQDFSNASNILEQLRQQVKNSLKQSETISGEVPDHNLLQEIQGNISENSSVFYDLEVKDGIDMALCVINTSTLILDFAGANCPLYMIRNNEFTEIEPTYNPVGIYFREEEYQNHHIQLQNGDILYLFTDGFIDMFGGENGGKFYAGRFKKLLVDIHEKPMKDQQKILENTIKEWIGDFPQIDDILVLGIRIM